MTESFVPRLQLNASRYSGGTGGGEVGQAGALNRTAAPPSNAAAAAAATHSLLSGGGAPTNNTSMTNHTSSSDWMRDSYASGGGARGNGAGGPPSPIPRFGENGVGKGGDAWAASWQRYANPQPTGGYRDGTDSGSRGMPGPSATRPLFTTTSASQPQDRNVQAGDTGYVAWSSQPHRAFTSSATAATSAAHPPAAPFSSATSTAYARPAFTSTYVGTSSGAMPASRQPYTSVGVSDADWRGTGASAAQPGADGLVSSRSRVRADRWTDEDPWGPATDNNMSGRGSDGDDDGDTSRSSGSASESSEASEKGHPRRSSRRYRRRSGGGQRSSRRHRIRGPRGRDSESGDDFSDETSGSGGGGDFPLSFADAIVAAMDSQPVVPLTLLRSAQEPPFIWNRHPSHGILLILLQHRGIYLPRYRELVDYHMAELFLHYIDLCREGAFFVFYTPGKWPKERFFRIRMLPVNRLEASTEPVPHLVITLHENAVDIMDAIPLDNLVGVTVTPQAACFRPFLESPNTIIGCREGRGHRARLPVDGAFSLWFYDATRHTSRSVDLLTCDAKVFDIWTKTFRGLVSVNSSSVVQVALTPQGESAELAERAMAAQQQGEIDHGESRGKRSPRD